MKYFLHSSTAINDDLSAKLMAKYGFEGYGIYNAILERIAYMESPIEKTATIFVFRLTKKQRTILDFLIEIGLLSEREEQIFNENILEVSEKYLQKKEKNREKVRKFRENSEKKIKNSEKFSENFEKSENILKKSEKNIVDNEPINQNVTGYNPDCNHNVTTLNKDNINKSKINKDNIIPEIENLQSKIAFLENELKLEKEKKAIKEPKEKTAPDPITSDAKNFFIEYFSDQKKIKYIWSAKEATSLKSLIQKIRASSESEMSNEMTLQLFEKIVRAPKEYDTWIYENLSISMLNSKFNELVSKIRNGKKANGVTYEVSDAMKERWRQALISGIEHKKRYDEQQQQSTN